MQLGIGSYGRCLGNKTASHARAHSWGGEKERSMGSSLSQNGSEEFSPLLGWFALEELCLGANQPPQFLLRARFEGFEVMNCTGLKHDDREDERQPW